MGHGIGHHRGRGISTHAARVWAGVAFADALVVLRGADGQNVCTVAEHEERCLFALHEFLDDHLGAGPTERAAEHIVYGGLGLDQRFGDDNALARRKAVGLDHDGGGLGLQVSLGRRRIRKMRIGCGRRA